MIKVSDYIAKRLKEVYNVENFFMVSGGGSMHLNDSLGRELKYICNHHEQACSMAADGYARVTGELAVVNVTTGPGGLNCLNGVFGQWADSIPVLYLSGQVKFSTTIKCCPEIPLRQFGDQEVDIVSVVKPLTKYSVMVTEPNEIKYHLDKAIYEATTGRPGPVWLDIPMNVQGAMVDEEDLIDFTPQNANEPKINCEFGEICKDIIKKLKSAKRPVIIAGFGIIASVQQKVFAQLVDALKIPVLTTFHGFEIIEQENPYYIGRIGIFGQRAGNFAVQNADQILCLGTRNNVRQLTFNWEKFAPKAYKIVVDIDKAELEKQTLMPDMPILADLKEFLPNLLENCEKYSSSHSEWLEWCKIRKEKYSYKNSDLYKEEGTEINPYNFANALSKHMGTNDVMTMGNGSACVCAFQTFEVKKGQKLILNSGDASMGYDLPSAIGACVANGRKSTVCVAGDGSIMMNLQELQTIKHNNLPIKIFIINNDGYISIKQTQKNFFKGHMTGSGVESGVSTPDFVEIGKAFGIKSMRISKNTEMNDKIQEVLDAKEPVICDVCVKSDYVFAPKLSSKKLPDGTMVSSSLEDMSPFLDPKELENNMINSESQT